MSQVSHPKLKLRDASQEFRGEKHSHEQGDKRVEGKEVEWLKHSHEQRDKRVEGKEAEVEISTSSLQISTSNSHGAEEEGSIQQVEIWMERLDTVKGEPPKANRGDGGGGEMAAKPKGPRRYIKQQVPDSILNDPALTAAMAVLPSNYNLEIPKTIWRIKQAGATRVALQFPEGLLMYSLTICDILEAFAGVDECFVLGDVTYGACCVDDFSAAALGADFLVHYGHSCLVPIDYSQIPCLYVFVDIQIDVPHLVETIKYNFRKDEKIALAGTIQFVTSLHAARVPLSEHFFSIVIPQVKPLSPGEVLGCTAPSLPNGPADVVVFVADGRFHLEAFMIANPEVRAFRYDPYSKILCSEVYDHKGMKAARREAIQEAQQGKHWGIVLGTLGRQGNPKVLNHVEEQLSSRSIMYDIFLISELSPSKIALFENTVDVWVQIACPRLSIDWGEAFCRPLLTPYEVEVALGYAKPWWNCEDTRELHCCSDGTKGNACGNHCQTISDELIGFESGIRVKTTSEGVKEEIYPMDYYARDGGPWSSSYVQTLRFPRDHRKNRN